MFKKWFKSHVDTIMVFVCFSPGLIILLSTDGTVGGLIESFALASIITLSIIMLTFPFFCIFGKR